MKFTKGGRYSVQNVEKRKKPKRTVLSYEDVPLDEYKEEGVEINKHAVKRVLIVAAILVVAGLIVFAIANRENLTPEKVGKWIQYDVLGSHDTGFPVRISGSNVSKGNFICDSGVAYVSDTAFVSLSNSGNEVLYRRHSFSKPVLESAGDRIIVYNRGGNTYSVGTSKEISVVNKTKDEQYIYAADINKNGCFCLVTEADGYLSKAYVYNSEGVQLYAYSFADYYINSIALNDSGSGCVACGVTGDSGSLQGIAYVLDFSEEQPRATFNLDDNIIYDVEYIRGDTVAAVGSNSTFVINTGSSSVKQIDYGSMELTAYDLNADTGTLALSVSRSGDGRLCSIQFYDSKGEPIKSIDSKHRIESLSLYKNRVAVLASGKVHLYDSEGKDLGSADAGNGAKAVKLDGADSAYVLGINEIRRIIEFEQ